MIAINRLLKDMKIDGFVWSSLQFNKNTISDPHRDKNNVGLSAILLIGDYTGGSLCVPGRSFKTPPGKSGIAAIIDGRELHQSEQFKGTRYSVVAFVHSSCDALTDRDRSRLLSLGFQIPPLTETTAAATPTVAANTIQLPQQLVEMCFCPDGCDITVRR